jgi:hypothetical protein
VVVAIEPSLPVTNPGPRGVIKVCPTEGDCGPANPPGIAGDSPSGALRAATGMRIADDKISRRNDLKESYDITTLSIQQPNVSDAKPVCLAA